jgi:hypothetical protein
MCAESLWWRCHRRIVTDHVLAHGVPVVHLFTRTHSEPASLTPFAVVGPRAVVSYPAPRPGAAPAASATPSPREGRSRTKPQAATSSNPTLLVSKVCVRDAARRPDARVRRRRAALRRVLPATRDGDGRQPEGFVRPGGPSRAHQFLRMDRVGRVGRAPRKELLVHRSLALT